MRRPGHNPNSRGGGDASDGDHSVMPPSLWSGRRGGRPCLDGVALVSPNTSGHSSPRGIPINRSHSIARSGVTRRRPFSMWVIVASLTPSMFASAPCVSARSSRYFLSGFAMMLHSVAHRRSVQQVARRPQLSDSVPIMIMELRDNWTSWHKRFKKALDSHKEETGPTP